MSAFALTVLALAVAPSVAFASLGVTTRASVSSAGVEGNAESASPSLSYDGALVAFSSRASNFHTPDSNNASDIFYSPFAGATVTITGACQRESYPTIVATGKLCGNGDSYDPVIGAPGVAFTSRASNLVPNDTNGYEDVFLFDFFDGEISRISVSSSGVQGNYHSGAAAIGEYSVAFQSDATNLVPGDTNLRTDIFLRDPWLGTTQRVSVGAGGQANDGSSSPAIGGGDRVVAFDSWASNLVLGDTNARQDVLVYDAFAGSVTRVSISSAGDQGNGHSYAPAVSADASFNPSVTPSGRYVAFVSDATNLVPGDTNGSLDVFVHDRKTRTTSRVSVSSSGAQGNTHSGWYAPAISADGRFVAFESDASNLVAGDTNGVRDVFVHDRQTGTTFRASVSTSGDQANAWSASPSLSGDGSDIAFWSGSSNLVAGDANGVADVFFRRFDDEPPTLTVPGSFWVDATDHRGAVVTYGVTATDSSGSATVACSPPSGSRFPIGTATVTCTATDPAGNTTTRTFAVHVKGAEEQIADLRDRVVAQGLDQTTTDELTTLLDAALDHVRQENVPDACSLLADFIAADKASDAEKGEPSELDDDARRIMAVLRCDKW